MEEMFQLGVAFQSERLALQCERVIGILWGGAFVFNVNIVRAREKVGRATSPLAVESGLQQCPTCEHSCGDILCVLRVASGDTLVTLFLN